MKKVSQEIIGCPPFKVVTFLFPYVIIRIKKNKTDLI